MSGPWTPRNPERSEAGHTLVFTTILGVLAMAVWAAAFQATQDTIREERFVLSRQVRDASVTRGLSVGVGLLRTGRPPDDPYAAIVEVVAGEQTYACVLEFATVAGAETWQVDCRWADEDDQATLPALPDRFEDDGEREGKGPKKGGEGKGGKGKDGKGKDGKGKDGKDGKKKD